MQEGARRFETWSRAEGHVLGGSKVILTFVNLFVAVASAPRRSFLGSPRWSMERLNHHGFIETRVIETQPLRLG